LDKQKIAWWLWAIGTTVIVLSWINVVGPTVGWCGFGIGLVGSVLGWGVRPPQSQSREKRDGGS
jgi:hypothetical protein